MSYYEKRIAELEARVAEMAREQRLKAIPVEAQLIDRIAELKAENERLRKAGDEMVNRIRWFERPFKSVAKCPEIEAWNAAKEGKPQS